MITFALQSENLLSVLGALYDIVGAVILGWGLIFVKARSMYRQAATGWGYSPTLLRVFSEQRVDATDGLFLLIVGFGIQGCAGWGYQTTDWLVVAFGAAVLAMLVWLHFLSRQGRAKRGFIDAMQSELKPDGSARYSDSEIENRWQDAEPKKSAFTPLA